MAPAGWARCTRDRHAARAQVALELLPAAFASDPERLARFDREAGLLASLNHTSIAHLYGFETATLEDGTTVHLIAMELVEGEDLGERLKRGAIPLDEAMLVAGRRSRSTLPPPRSAPAALWRTARRRRSSTSASGA